MSNVHFVCVKKSSNKFIRKKNAFVKLKFLCAELSIKTEVIRLCMKFIVIQLEVVS